MFSYLRSFGSKMKIFQIERDKNKGLGCCHQYLPSLDILTLISISHFQHEEDWSHVSNGTNSMQGKKEIKKNTTQKTQTHFAFRKSFKTIKILWSAHLCPLHYATNAGYLTTGQSSFLALPIYIFITPLNSYFYSLLHSHLWHYKYVSSLFCCGGLVFMPSATHLAWSNQPPEFQKQTYRSLFTTTTTTKSPPCHFLAAFIISFRSAMTANSSGKDRINWNVKTKKNCLQFSSKGKENLYRHTAAPINMHRSITYYTHIDGLYRYAVKTCK